MNKPVKTNTIGNFTELVTVRAYFDCKYIGLNEPIVRLGSGTKIDKFQDLLIVCALFIFLYFSTRGADEFRETIEKRWRKLRSEPTRPEQTWLIPQPSRSTWSDSREFNKVNFVREMVGYRPRINTKNSAKCMDTYLKGAPESELVMTKLGPVKDYLPVEAPLLDFLTVVNEGPTGWKYPKLEELRKFQQKRGLTYSILEDVEVREIICGVSSTEEIVKNREFS